MPKVRYIEPDGAEHDLDVDVGTSVMEGAVKAGLPGIEATCGGACSCATCHVYVDPAWSARIGSPDDMEEAMLEHADDPRPTSRLSCQIRMTEDLDGLVVDVPQQN